MILRPRLEPVGHWSRRGREFGDVQRLEPLAFPVEDADVRAIKLVGGAGEEVASPILNIHQLMGAKCTASTNVSASASRAMATARGDVVDRSQCVGGGPDRQQPASMIVQAAVQVVPVELAGLGDHLDLEDGDAALPLEGAPGIDVGVMVELGDDDRVSRPSDRPRARARWNVRVVMLAPKAISSGEALRKSAKA